MLSEQAMQTIDMLRGHKIRGAAMARTETGTPEERAHREMLRVFEGRRAMEEMALLRPLPDGVSAQPVLADGVPCEWQRYADADPEKCRDKVILFLHGGGFSGGSAATRRVMSAGIVRHAKVDALSVNYRLCPENRFPAGLYDCETAYVWLLRQGYRSENIYVMGESAGGNLSVAIVHYLRAHSLPLPGGICAFSPVVDLEDRFESRVLRANRDPMIGPFLDEKEIPAALERLKTGEVAGAPSYCTVEERKSPFASPIHGDFTGFPKLLIEVGSEEILYDDSVELERKAREAGVDVRLHVWEGLFHSFAIFDIPETDEVCIEIAAFVREA